jgi:hypothetical protein
MKALISPNENFNIEWISSWNSGVPVYSEIQNCQRVAEVEPDDKTFSVAPPLYWISCPNNCKADEWYFKDGKCSIKPQDVPKPEGV